MQDPQEHWNSQHRLGYVAGMYGTAPPKGKQQQPTRKLCKEQAKKVVSIGDVHPGLVCGGRKHRNPQDTTRDPFPVA
jgi:hypothetical protein